MREALRPATLSLVNSPSRVPPQVLAAAARAPGLELLVLFGSRARGDARPASDWDFAYEADARFDPQAFAAALVLALGTEQVDLVDLARAGALLRFRVARDGSVVAEARPALFRAFWLAAVAFWCDVEPVLRAAYERSLARLTP